jgi:hypothetical protein
MNNVANIDKKAELIKDIQNLLNSYEGVAPTSLNPEILSFMSENDLKGVIGSLLDQKEEAVANVDIEWLNKFKSIN